MQRYRVLGATPETTEIAHWLLSALINFRFQFSLRLSLIHPLSPCVNHLANAFSFRPKLAGRFVLTVYRSYRTNNTCIQGRSRRKLGSYRSYHGVSCSFHLFRAQVERVANSCEEGSQRDICPLGSDTFSFASARIIDTRSRVQFGSGWFYRETGVR